MLISVFYKKLIVKSDNQRNRLTEKADFCLSQRQTTVLYDRTEELLSLPAEDKHISSASLNLHTPYIHTVVTKHMQGVYTRPAKQRFPQATDNPSNGSFVLSYHLHLER